MIQVILMFLVLLPTWASVDTVVVQGAEIHYQFPRGVGEVDKIIIHYPQKPKVLESRQAIDIFRLENSFELATPFLSFQWLNPWAFMHNLKTAEADKVELSLKKTGNSAHAAELSITDSEDRFYSIKDLSVNCAGESRTNDMGQRIIESCLKKMSGKINDLILPLNILDLVAQDMPEDIPEENRPADDFLIEIENGDFFTHLKIKYYIKATVRVWGHIQMDQNGKAFAMRVDQVKYGILPVTQLVLNELKKRVNHPDLEIDPPWIRYKMK